MNVGFHSSPSPRKKRMVKPSPFTAMGSATNLALGFLLLVFFLAPCTPWKRRFLLKTFRFHVSFRGCIIFTTWTNSWPISSASTIFTSCNFECMSCYIRRCLCLHIPPIQSSSKYIRRIIPKSWFCSTSLWIRQAVCSSTQYSMICFLYLLVYWEGSLLGKCLAYSLHAHFMPHLQKLFFECLCFYLEKHHFKGKSFRKFLFLMHPPFNDDG